MPLVVESGGAVLGEKLLEGRFGVADWILSTRVCFGVTGAGSAMVSEVVLGEGVLEEAHPKASL